MQDHITTYLSQLRSILTELDPAEIQRIARVLHEARLRGRSIFLLGNGGSAATASHWANDLSKGAIHPDWPRLRAIALTDNVPLITAWANDTAYENIFSEQLVNLLRAEDIVIAISGSGNSPNVLKAVQYARGKGAFTVGLTGFAGGRLKALVDLCVVVPSNSMEQIEDVHMILTHAISTSLRQQGTAKADAEASAQPAVRIGGRAVFIDRDGVINENREDYVKSWEEFRFLDGSLKALAALAASDFVLIVVSNQSGIGRRLVTQETVEWIHHRMLQQVESSGGRIDQLLYCPHRPEDNCACRKPRPGLLQQAGRELGVDLSSSYLIGDSLEDIQAGIEVGCTTLLVRTGRGQETVPLLDRFNGSRPIVVDDLAAAVRWILEQENARKLEPAAQAEAA